MPVFSLLVFSTEESGIATTVAGEKGGSGIATATEGADDEAAAAGTDDETTGFCFLVGFIGFVVVFAETGIDFVG